jgi:hypothetical protein
MKKAGLIIAVLFFAGCNKSPFERTRDASGSGFTGQLIPGGTLRVFSSELLTGGGAFEYPGSENQTLTFNDRSNPISQRSIRYNWNGQPAATGGTDHTFAGFDLMHTALFSQYASTPGRNLQAAGYTKATFYARGSLSSNTALKVEVADEGNQATPDGCLTLSTGTTDACGNGATKQLTGDWQQYTIMIPAAALQNVKDIFKATFVFTDPLPGVPGQAPGQGGTVYLDQIQYEP